MKQFTTTIIDVNENTIEGNVNFFIDFPDSWIISDNVFYTEDNRKIAEILPCILCNDKTVFDELQKKYPSVEGINVTMGTLEGKYFFLQTPVEDPAFEGSFNNEIFYYLKYKDYLLCIKFYPARGVGIGPQRKKFQEDIKLIK